MKRTRGRPLVIVTLILAGASVAPAPPEDPVKPAPSPLAQERYEAAVKQFEIVWSYFKQARTDSYQVYVWSRLVLDARRDLGETPADRRTALEEHLARMSQMEELVKKIRRLGFGLSSDIGASRYYRLEAQLWLERCDAK